MVKKGRLQRLAAKIISGKATDAEKRLLDAYYDAFDGMKDRDDPLTEAGRAALGEAIRGRIRLGDAPVKSMRRWIPYAAAILLFASVVGYFAVDSRKSSVDGLAAADIQPGGNRATLTLADGRVVDLDEAQAGIIVGAEGIIYQDGTSLGTVIPSEELILTTPKGGTYQVTLPDGSKVWLNAASTLRYPSRFTGDERVVVLEGEAFFEIKGIEGTRAPSLSAGARVSRVPFKVQTSGQTVEVLGTQFNISAYVDEAETKTTLVEGKVKVTPGTQKGTSVTGHRSSDSAVLTPGQQASTHGAHIKISHVDVAQFTAWRDGLIVLNHADLPAIIRQIERWYDVDIELPEITGTKRMFGEIPRNVNLSVILDALTDYYGITFKREGRKIIGST